MPETQLRASRHRLGLLRNLGMSFKTTNFIESIMARPEAKTRQVTRWRASDRSCDVSIGALGGGTTLSSGQELPASALVVTLPAELAFPRAVRCGMS